MAKKLIIFDIDGTITDTVAIDDRSFKESFLELYDLDIKEVSWNDFPHATDWGLSEYLLREELGIKKWEDELERLQNYFLKKLQKFSQDEPNQFKEIPNSVGFINHLHEMGYHLGIATGAWKKSAEIKLKQVGLDYGNIPWANSSDHYSRQEITKICIDRAKEKYQKDYKIDEILYFGDGEWDYQTTIKMKISFIGIDKHADGKLFRSGQRKIIRDYKDEETIMGLINSY